MKFEIIELWHPVTECTICGRETPLKWSIPMYEGKKVDTDKSDEWAGMPVCKECYDKDANLSQKDPKVNT